MEFLIFTASHKEDVLKNNLMKSKFINDHMDRLMIMRDHANVSQALNFAVDISGITFTSWPEFEPEFFIFVHNDVVLPDSFEDDLQTAILDLGGENWGVLGVAGARWDAILNRKEECGYINDRGREWGQKTGWTHKVQTVDELLLIVRNDQRLRFDETLPQDFYGADLCMQAHELGMSVKVFESFVHHNSTRPVGGRTPSFYESEKRFREKWAHKLPICTTCSTLK